MAVLLMKQTIIKGCVVYKYTLKYRACTGKAACVHPQTLSRAGGMYLDPTRSASPCSYMGPTGLKPWWDVVRRKK